LGSESLGRVR